MKTTGKMERAKIVAFKYLSSLNTLNHFFRKQFKYLKWITMNKRETKKIATEK